VLAPSMLREKRTSPPVIAPALNVNLDQVR
jgi:hypothetical protein